ncbi:MAG: dCTP deaminase [Candidatus Micrarchaeota archaeon]
MILSDKDILELMRKKKLVITPFEKEQLGQASVDLTLSNRFWKFKEAFIGKRVDLRKIDFKEATEEVAADSLELSPGEMCLGLTVEHITLPGDIMGHLEGRSKYARMGLAVHVTSSVVQPGSDNRQVLEIVNMSPFKLVIHEGMRISQVLFERLESATGKPYARFGKIARKQ